MEHLFEYLTFGVSLAAIVLMLSIVLVNIYVIKREGFRVTVNCWFCNSWTRVLYSDRNSFECPTCHQYNGFTKDGGYNKVINAQHNTSLTKTVDNMTAATNGLCTYCNNNQRLKVVQLANFIPLNEQNYDVEIEHFKKQLEKSYKLCGKCQRVLKVTLDRQHAWLFGKHLINLKTKAVKVISLSKDLKPTHFAFVRYLLTFLNVIMFCYLLNIKIELPPFQNVKKFLPSYWKPYTVVVKDFYNKVTTDSNIFVPEFLVSNKINVNLHFLTVISSLGLFLHTMLMIVERKSNWWKVNEMFTWMVLLLTSLVRSTNVYSGHIEVLQVFICCILLYSYLQGKSLSKKQIKGQFKKIKNNDISGSIDKDSDGNLHSSILSGKLSKSTVYNNLNTSNCQSFRASSPIQNCQFQNSFDSPFCTANTTSLVNSSSNSGSPRPGDDLHQRLNNLHLNNSTYTYRPQPCSSPVFSINSSKLSELSPPKLNSVTHNPWTAGGFWKNDVTAYQVGVEDGLRSRSSSQTSGFVSNQAFNSLPASRDQSVCGDAERTAYLPKPIYHVNPCNSLQSPGHQLYYKAENNTFYPVLNQNNMLFLQGGFSNFIPNFSTLSANGSPPPPSNMTSSPVMFTNKPVSRLFKNIQGPGTSGFHNVSF